MKRSTAILVILFIVLGVTVILVEKPFSEPESVTQLNPELGPMFSDLDRDAVTKMKFASFGGSTILEKKDDKWFVIDNDKQFPADPDAVEKVFETLEKMVAVEVVSRDPGKHMKFQVNSPQDTEMEDETGAKKPFHMGTLGTEVILYDADNNELVHLFIGKNGTADFMTTYVRKNGSDSVVLVDGYLKSIFAKGSPKNWKDRLLCKINMEDIDKITLGTGKKAIILKANHPEKDESKQAESSTETSDENEITWTMISPKKGEVAKHQGDRIARMFREFKASDYAPELDDPEKYGFDKPTATVSIDLNDGSRVTFIIGSESDTKKNNFYIKKEGDDRIFIIPEYRVKQFQREPDDFFKEPNAFRPSKSPKRSPLRTSKNS